MPDAYLIHLLILVLYKLVARLLNFITLPLFFLLILSYFTFLLIFSFRMAHSVSMLDVVKGGSLVFKVYFVLLHFALLKHDCLYCVIFRD